MNLRAEHDHTHTKSTTKKQITTRHRHKQTQKTKHKQQHRSRKNENTWQANQLTNCTGETKTNGYVASNNTGQRLLQSLRSLINTKQNQYKAKQLQASFSLNTNTQRRATTKTHVQLIHENTRNSAHKVQLTRHSANAFPQPIHMCFSGCLLECFCLGLLACVFVCVCVGVVD